MWGWESSALEDVSWTLIEVGVVAIRTLIGGPCWEPGCQSRIEAWVLNRAPGIVKGRDVSLTIGGWSRALTFERVGSSSSGGCGIFVGVIA
jgi:hypothetical protein